jgi:DNA-binding MarR family transcriptional regulator
LWQSTVYLTKDDFEHRHFKRIDTHMPPSKDDLGPLGERLGFRLRLAQNAVFKQGEKAFGKIGLRPQEYGLLLLINYAPGRKQKDVAAALGIRDANLVSAIDELEERDLVSRSRSPQDGRLNVLHLTKDGKNLLGRAKQIDARLDKAFDRKIGKAGRVRLVKLLTKLVAPD